LAAVLEDFEREGFLPKWFSLERLREGRDLVQSLIVHEAKWHVSCGVRFSRQALTRLKHKRDKENVQFIPITKPPILKLSFQNGWNFMAAGKQL
jgi:hypothetical protein